MQLILKKSKTLKKRGFFKVFLLMIFSFFFYKKNSKADLILSEFERRTGFSNYGIPSKFEKIFRWIVANSSLSGNGLSFTPLSKLRGSLIPNGLHFERHHYGVMQIDPKKYNLEIIFQKKSRIFSLNELRNFELKTIKTFIECAGNSNQMYNKKPMQTGADNIHGLFSVSEWTGISLKKIFDKHNIKKKELWLEFTSLDKGSYNISLPFKHVIKKGILALYQNGEPIRPEQGYPVRLIVPGWEGSTHVKWLKKINFREGPAFSRNETSRYTDLLPSGKSRQYSFAMESKSVILSPSHGQKVVPGNIIVSGLAWSGRSYIKKVEVSLDKGKTWHKAGLSEKKKNVVRFYYKMKWDSKDLVIQSRCIDGKNYIQPGREKFLKKMGNNSFYHFSAITYWKISSDGKVNHTYV